MTKKRKTMVKRAPDFTLFLSVMVLVIIGIIMVFSASGPEAIEKFNDGNHFIKRQLLYAGLGFMALVTFMNIDYMTWRKWGPYLYIISIGLGALVLLTPLGQVHNGAKRWLKFPGLPQFMPADIVKVTSIMYLARMLSVKQRDIKSLLKGTIPVGAVIGLSILTFIKNDMGTSMIIVLTLGALWFVGGLNLMHIVPIIPAGVIGLMAFAKKGFRNDRLVAFRDPFKYKQDIGWQVVQSLYALGSGGIFGVGLGKSRQKFFYLSEAYNDFVFAIIAEELGLVGAVLVLIVFGVLVFRGVKISIATEDLYGKYLSAGLTALIGIQAIIHVAVVTSSIPTTGVTLPFISYGGTSLIITMSAMGILLNISRQADLDRS